MKHQHLLLKLGLFTFNLESSLHLDQSVFKHPPILLIEPLPLKCYTTSPPLRSSFGCVLKFDGMK